MKVWIRALFVCLIMGYQNLYAVEVARLYETEVIAESEQEKDKLVAVKRALGKVLMRILAGDDIFQDATVNSVLATPMRYVDEYQYSLAETRDKDARLMRVLFNEELLVSTLRAGKISLWNEIRPRTLVWLVVEEQGRKLFFDPDEMPEIGSALNKASKQKKIPVLLPMQDLREKRVLSIADVLSAYSEHLLEVSVRYEVVSTLAGKIVKSGGCWRAEWTLYFDAKIEQWRSSCASVDNVTLAGIQGVYDRLSTYYAAKSEIDTVTSAVIKVSGIKRMNAISEVTNYLETLPMIKTATWFAAKGGDNVYRIFYQGAREEMDDALNSGGVLKVKAYNHQSDNEIKYQFLNH